MKQPLTMALCWLGAAGSAWAQIYRCEHAGRVHYADRPCAQGPSVPQKKATPAPKAHTGVQVQTQHYPVRGTTPAAVRADVRSKGPMGFAGYARWRVSYQYKYDRTGEVCRISQITIDTEATILMPEWQGLHQASAADQAWWRHFYDRLMRHEEGHVQHGREFAILLREKLMGLGGVACDGLSAKAQSVYDQLMKNLQHRDAEYDRRTEHGLRQEHPL